MLCFDDDAALCHLLIAATAIPVAERARWLQNLADRLEPPSDGDANLHLRNGNHGSHLPGSPSAAQRQERRRQRAARGLVVLPVELPFIELSERLVDEGLIGAWDATDREVVKDALSKIIRHWISHA